MKELLKSLAAFQQEVKPIYKNTDGYGYRYADLTAILEKINPLMQKHELGFTQTIIVLDGRNALQTIIYHTETGDDIVSTCLIPDSVQLKGMNDFQVLGSAITYLRRYGLSAVLGLVTDADIDASGEQVKPSKKASKPQSLDF
jgi:hypothetical protein